MHRVKPISDFLWVLSGPAIWAVHFFSIYLVEALLCTSTMPSGTVMTAATSTITGAALLALLGIVAYRRSLSEIRMNTTRDEKGFLAVLTLMLITLSSLAVTWAAMPGFWLPVCAFSPG